MNWITDYVRPKIKSLVTTRSDIPDNLWRQCPACETMLFYRDLLTNHNVCQSCGHHLRLPVKERLELIFDDQSHTIVELPESPSDPLRFRDRRRYADRLKEARLATGRDDAIVVAHGTIGQQNAVAAVFDFGFLGGSMGVAVGNAILVAARLAVYQEAALLIVPSSGGARMQEGILSLMQMPRTAIAIRKVKEARLPYIVILTDPTTGGVSASFAMLGDIAIAEPGAIIGFAGARVIEETIRQKLPDGFQCAEYLLEHGMVDMVVPRAEQHETLARIIGLLTCREKPAEIAAPEPQDQDENDDAAVTAQ